MRARTAVVAGLSTAALLVAPAASFAYGPSGNGPTPPGFGTTEGACNAGPAGCDLHAVSAKCHLKVTVPKDAFDSKTNIVVSTIKKDSANGHLDGTKTHAVCAFGIGIFRNNKRVSVPTGNPKIKLDFTGLPIRGSDHLRILIPGGNSKSKHATFSTGEATSTLISTHELAIVRADS